MRIHGWMLMTCLALAAGRAEAGEPNCTDILRFGVFDETTLRKDTDFRRRLDESLCKTDFGTHEEARRYGLGVGIPVYGVPLKLSGEFDQQQKQSWFKKHCEERQLQEDFQQVIGVAMRRASPVVVEAWSACMRDLLTSAKVGLRCDVLSPDPEHVVFTAQWKKGHAGDPGPKVQALRNFGGDCERPSLPERLGDRLSLGCKRASPRDPVTVLLETESDTCMLTVPGVDTRCAERRFKAGATELFSADTAITCRRIVFEDGAKVRVENGATLRLNAQESISVLGSAVIDGTGNPGKQGPPGASRGGVWISQKRRDFDDALNDCRSNPQHHDRGLAGGQGGPGGKGATVILSKVPSGTLTIAVSGGPGGSGGNGGAGKLLRNGENFHCDGCTMNCPPGDNGPPGDKGDDGATVYLERAVSEDAP